MKKVITGDIQTVRRTSLALNKYENNILKKLMKRFGINQSNTIKKCLDIVHNHFESNKLIK